MGHKLRTQLDIISLGSLGSSLHGRGGKKTIFGTCVSKSKVKFAKNVKKVRFYVTSMFWKYWKLGHSCKITMQCFEAENKLKVYDKLQYLSS